MNHIKVLFFLAALFIAGVGRAQLNLTIIVKDSITNEHIPNATITCSDPYSKFITNADGIVVVSGLHSKTTFFSVSSVGHAEKKVIANPAELTTLTVYLRSLEKNLEEITVISSTRNNQRIENSPLKVEVLGKEEMDEENTIKPANIASLLSDVSGVQIQQSSAVTGNANVRILGLEGRYTQILKDGMPLFEGFAGSFGVLTVPPFDLKQIELIKGSASTLFGGGAIGGLINLISKKPAFKQETVITLNQSTLKERNFNIYTAIRNKQFGYSFFGGYTHQEAVDVNDDGLSDVSRQQVLIFHPKFFIYPSSKTHISFGYNGIFQELKGGDMLLLKQEPDANHQFFEQNNNRRHSADFIAEHRFSDAYHLTMKAIVSSFNRKINTGSYAFTGRQINYYSELSLLIKQKSNSMVTGINITGDAFNRRSGADIPIHHISNTTLGAFAQYTFCFRDNLLLETGLRTDYHQHYGFFVLPRIALFKRMNEHWATRLGVGIGYKTPEPLSSQNKEYDIRKIQPLTASVTAEKSYSFNAEINYKHVWNQETSFFINHAFFLTTIQHPVVANESMQGDVSFSNAVGNVTTAGFDTYVKIEAEEFEIYAGYTFTIARRNYLPDHPFVPLTPKNRAAFTIVKEIESSWRFGVEGSYTGSQYRDGDESTPEYFFAAAMAERKFGKHFSVIANMENILNYKQSDYEPLFTGSLTDPHFKPLWAPIDGRVFNVAVKVVL